jgi:hypothetical protein
VSDEDVASLEAAIDSMRIELDEMREERDEARRMYCHAAASIGRCTPARIAEQQGWDLLLSIVKETR